MPESAGPSFGSRNGKRAFDRFSKSRSSSSMGCSHSWLKLPRDREARHRGNQRTWVSHRSLRTPCLPPVVRSQGSHARTRPPRGPGPLAWCLAVDFDCPAHGPRSTSRPHPAERSACELGRCEEPHTTQTCAPQLPQQSEPIGLDTLRPKYRSLSFCKGVVMCRDFCQQGPTHF